MRKLVETPERTVVSFMEGGKYNEFTLMAAVLNNIEIALVNIIFYLWSFVDTEK